MAVLQRVALQPNERFDTPDARALEAYSLNDWRFFLSGFYSPTSLVLTGFEIANYNTIFTVPGFQLTLNDVVLFHTQATGQAAGFYVFAGTESNAVVSLSPSATNFVEVDLADASGTPDVRAFWDQGANGGAGGEFTDTIDTVINLNLTVTSNITSFTAGKIPLYKVITNASGIVTSVTDCRNMMFRLAPGGDSPSPNYNFVWPTAPDSAHSRFETPVTSTAATVSNAPFQGGDKNLKTFKDWMNAVMTMLKEVKSTPYWYSPLVGGGGIATVYQNAALTILSGGLWTQNPPFLTTTGNLTVGSNQLTSLANVTGILGGNVQTVSGVDIPSSPLTTVSSIVGTTVTMSANALATAAGETVSFARAAGGLLQLAGTSVLHRLGFQNPHSFLSPFLIDLAIQEILYVILSTGDYSVTYGYGQDGATPIVPQQVAALSTTSITVPTGGNYITGPGNLMVHGQTFSYTSYTPGTGFFAGVSPDPSGVVAVNDVVYQLDSGGTGYYHYSSHEHVPSVVSGVSYGAERVYWIAHFNPGGTTITLRFGQILPGETISENSSAINNILSYIGSPSAATTVPQYTVTASGALSGETNYNSNSGDDLTTRVSLLTTMMADKAQDKQLGFLASGFSKIFNTTSGGNQQLSFLGGGTLTVSQAGAANNGTVGLSGTLNLAVNQVAYYTIDRNSFWNVANIGSLTVSNISAMPINENSYPFAWRLGDQNIYLWNGQVIPVGDTPTIAELELEINQNWNSKLINGGIWSWDQPSSTLTWNADAQIQVLGIADSVNNILAGSVTLADGEVAWVSINRTGPGGNLTVNHTAVASLPAADETFAFARRTGNDVLIGHSFRLTDQEFKALDQGISNENLAYIGAANEASFSPTYSSTTYIHNGDSLTTAAGELDARATTQTLVVNQQRGAQLIGGGQWAWNAGISTLTWPSQANLAIPGLADSVNNILAGSIVLADGQVAYVEVNRTGPGGNLTVLATNESALSVDDNTVVIARRVGTTVALGYHGKTLLQDGESKEIGAGLSVQNRTFIGAAGEATSAPTYTGPNRAITQSSSLTSAISSMDTQLDHWFGQFRLQPRAGHPTQVTVTGVDFTMLDSSVLSQTLSNLVVAFTGAVIDFSTGSVFQSDGITALGINFTPFTVPANQYFWYSVNAVASSVNANNAITIQMLINAASSASAVAANAPYAAFTSSGKNLGQVQVFNNAGSLVINTIRQLGVGSGSGGGIGNVTDIYARAETKLADSRYQLATVSDFLFDAQTKVTSATATYDVANSRYNFTTAGQNIVSINLLDANEFLSQGIDCTEAEVDLYYLTNFVDKTPTVNLSRDGGNNYFPVTMSRIGTTDLFNGRVAFGTEATHVTLAQQASGGTPIQLNASTIQSLEQEFTLAAASTITSFQLTFSQQGTPAGLINLQIVKDSSGSPSSSPSDIVAQMTQSASSLTGTVTFSVTAPLAAGNYHLVIAPNAAYQAGFNAVTAGLSVTSHTPGAAPFAQQYNGTTWSSTGNNLMYLITGRVMSLVLQVVSSASTNWDDPTKAILNGFSVFYNPSISQVASAYNFLEVQQVNGTNNINAFTLNNFYPDPQFLKVYVNETGQCFRYGAFSLNGQQVVFPANSFSAPGQTYTLTFDQQIGGGFDSTDNNALLLAANHLGSTNASIDRSVSGLGIFLRRPDGTLREIAINNNDEIVIYSV